MIKSFMALWLNKILALLAVVAVFYVWAMHSRLASVEGQLETANALIKQQSAVLEAQNTVVLADRRISRAADNITRTIRELPNAEEHISPDVASTWHAGIIRLRNDGEQNDAAE